MRTFTCWNHNNRPAVFFTRPGVTEDNNYGGILYRISDLFISLQGFPHKNGRQKFEEEKLWNSLISFPAFFLLFFHSIVVHIQENYQRKNSRVIFFFFNLPLILFLFIYILCDLVMQISTQKYTNVLFLYEYLWITLLDNNVLCMNPIPKFHFYCFQSLQALIWLKNVRLISP